MAVPSQPPPSQKLPEKSGGGLYFVGALALVGAALGLYFWKKPPPPPPVTPQATTATATAKPEVPVALYAPPPPPKLDEEDAGTDAGPAPTKSTAGTGVPGPSPCAGTCVGQATSALSSALRGRAQSAQGCYNRALRTSEVSGSLTVSVQVGPSGQVCSASLVNDTVHSTEVASCVLSRFRGQSFPPPSGGCIVANIPISFTIKQ